MAQRPKPLDPSGEVRRRNQAQQSREEALRKSLEPREARGRRSFLEVVLGSPTQVHPLDPKTGLPIVDPPPSWDFSGDLVGPGTEVARMMRQLEGIVPGLRGRAGKITMGPNREMIRRLFRAGKPDLLGYGRTPVPRKNVTGTYWGDTGSIYLAPEQKGADLFSTLAHELQHASKPSWTEDPAELAGALAKMVYRESDTPPSLQRVPQKTRRRIDAQLDEFFKDEPWYQPRESLDEMIKKLKEDGLMK